MIELVLGGNKSGKSDFGLNLLRKCPTPRILVATGKSRDLAFREQIDAHRREREPEIEVREADTDLAGTLRIMEPLGGGILVDSLDYWLFSLMGLCAGDRKDRQAELLAEISGWQGGKLVFVSTEMGLGPIAFDGAVRAFARDMGQLNREIASACSSVYLVVAGLAQKLK